MAITAKAVAELREITGSGMMDCKRALEATEGDVEKAVEYLREKGLAQAAKKASRIAGEGIVAQYISEDAKTGVLIEVNCETDFVAKMPEYKAFVDTIAKQIADKKPTGADNDAAVAALLAQSYECNPEKSVADAINDQIAKLGEKISVRRFTIYESTQGIAESYIHLGGKIGVLVELKCDAYSAEVKSVARDAAMQVAAAKPSFLNQSEIPADVMDKEREIQRAKALNEGKSEAIVDKMIIGRMKKFAEEICLVDQLFIKDQDITVKKMLENKSKELSQQLEVLRFTRYEMGEGLEKRSDDFAAEVMKQAGM